LSLLWVLLCGAAPNRENKGAQQDKLPDLAIHQAGLGKAGSVIYQVANGGSSSTGGFFVVDIYIDGVRRDSIRHEPLPAMSMQTVESNLARFAQCQTGTLRLTVDIQNTIRESNEKNNDYTGKLAAPCPKAP
jgi:subtilase family serine protease